MKKIFRISAKLEERGQIALGEHRRYHIEVSQRIYTALSSTFFATLEIEMDKPNQIIDGNAIPQLGLGVWKAR